jgi:hypothetical protein
MNEKMRALMALLALFASLTVAANIMSTYNETTSDQYVEMTSAYCKQAYNDSDIVGSNVLGGHGGLHCRSRPKGNPHIHQVERKYLRRALNATRNGTDLNWTAADVQRHVRENR